MKLHRIEIENLNSLFGIQEIDFDGELKGAPLFLIMGPTGAGKTTILDAICLTLFGTTPRVKDERGTTAVSTPGERLMTTGTWFCKAELEFSLLDGQGIRHRYKAAWRCERTHKSATGRVKNPDRSLKVFEADGNWKTLASGHLKKDYEEHFETVLRGMTEDSFLRSVMLAQGQFSAFLQATEDQKAAILERLTKTHEYRHIGERARVVKQAKEQGLRDKQKLLDALPQIDAGSLILLEEGLEGLRDEEKVKGDALGVARGRVEWFESYQKLVAEGQAVAESVQNAASKREAHGEDFARLEVAQRARPVEKLLDDVDRLGTEQKGLDESLPGLREGAVASAKALGEREAEQKTTHEGLRGTKKAYEDRLPEIKRARDLVVKHGEATRQLDALKGKKKAALAELEKYVGGVKAATDIRDAAQGRRESSEKALEELAGFGELVESLSGLTESYSVWQQKVGELGRQRDRRQGLVDAQGHLLTRQKSVEEELVALEEGIKPLEDKAGADDLELRTLLGEAPDVATRRKELKEGLEDVRGRIARAEEARRLIGEKGKKGEELSANRAREKGLSESLVEIEKEAAGLVGLVEAREDAAKAKNESLEIIKQALALGKEREGLEAGEPCPLCGSEDHPYLASGTHQEADEKLGARRAELAGELALAEAALAEVKSRTGELQTKKALVLQQLEAVNVSIEGLVVSLEELAEDLAKLDVGQDGAEDMEALIRGLDEERFRLSEASQDLEDGDRKASNSGKALEKSREGVNASKQALDKLGIELSTLKERLEELDAQISELEENIQGQERALIDSLRAVGVEVADGSELAAALKSAAAGRDKYVGARDEALAAAAALEKAVAALEGANQQVVDAEPRVAALILEGENQEKILAGLADEIGSLLEGRGPDEVELELTAAINAAEVLHEAAQSARANASEFARLQAQQLAAAETGLAEVLKELESKQAALAKKLAEQGFADVPELRRALLSEEAFASLQGTTQGIEKELLLALERSKSIQERCNAHDEARPAGLVMAAVELEGLRDVAEALDEDFRELQQRLGQVQEQLKSNRGELEHRRKLEGELAILAKDMQVWKEIYSLIGVNNGGAFQKYAQALNLRELVYRANKHLDTLTDRYRLKVADVGGLRLDFDVLDAHHANTARPLSTLSGGEVFLVSLAMALALADCRQLDLKMEILLLDEGFGTLDVESLSTALSLLNNLHLDGNRQVGLISHVDGLKERIPHRIHVQKLGNGRSKITVLGPSD